MGLTGFNRRRREIAALRAKANVSPVSEKKQETVVETKVEEPKVEKVVKEETPKTTTKKATKK